MFMGEFVRNVIIPRTNDPNCEIPFNNIDIWFCDLERQETFKQKLNNYFEEDKALTLRHREVIGCKSKYIFNYTNDYSLYITITITVSKEFPTQNFDVNYLRYRKYGEFVMSGYGFSDNVSSNFPMFKNNQTVMSSNYNPTTEEEFNQINKDYFQKGWSIIVGKQTELSKWIVKNNVPVTIGIEDGRWIYSPNKSDVKIYIPSLKMCGTEKDIKTAIKAIYPEYSDERINDIIKDTVSNACNVTIKPKWARDTIEQNDKNNYFIDVGKGQVSYRLLSGSTRLWSSPDLKENEIVYVLPLRICGTHNDIRSTLKSAEPPYTESEIDNYLRDAISKYNYQTTKAHEYNQEIADFRSKRKSKNTKWSRDLIRPFAEARQFARVGRENLTRVNLSVASHFWIYNPELNMIVFILPLRICGTPDDIRKTLRSIEPPYSEDEINNHLKDAITKDNYQTTKADDYNKEIGNPLSEIFKLAKKITNDFMDNNIISPNNTNFNTILSGLIKDISDNPKEDKLKEDKSQSNLPKVGFMTEETDDIPVLKENVMRVVGGDSFYSRNPDSFYPRNPDSFYPKNLGDKSKDIKDIKDIKNITGGDEAKAVMRSIFSAGLESLNEKFNNDTESKELQYIYKCGLDQYRDKFNQLLKEM